jgi:methylated-DNA-[protein]-cysteine S-methyltransferase
MSNDYYTRYNSPLGELLMTACDSQLTGLYLPLQENKPDISRLMSLKDNFFDDIFNQLDDYFSGKSFVFKIKTLARGTAFQQHVWDSLKKIVYGEYVAYSQIAESIGKPKAVRAVASAVAKNPISIIIPCHRIISKDGSLGGYAGGLEVKKYLIAHENKKATLGIS